MTTTLTRAIGALRAFGHEALAEELRAYTEQLKSELARVSALPRLAQALVDKLNLCKPAISAALQMSQIHGMPYSGPTYGVELKALTAALAGPDGETKECPHSESGDHFVLDQASHECEACGYRTDGETKGDGR